MKTSCILAHPTVQYLKHTMWYTPMYYCAYYNSVSIFMCQYHSIIHMKNKHGRNEQTILRKIRGTNGIGHIVDIKHIKMNWVTVVAE